MVYVYHGCVQGDVIEKEKYSCQGSDHHSSQAPHRQLKKTKKTLDSPISQPADPAGGILVTMEITKGALESD